MDVRSPSDGGQSIRQMYSGSGAIERALELAPVLERANSISAPYRSTVEGAGELGHRVARPSARWMPIRRSSRSVRWAGSAEG